MNNRLKTPTSALLRYSLIAITFVTLTCNAANKEVTSIFKMVEKGDTSTVSELIKLGSDIIPDLVKYLEHNNDNVRREAVSLLGVLGGKDACLGLLNAMTDTSADIRERVARHLYRCERSVLINNSLAATKIIKSVKMGNTAAASILLLAYFPTTESKNVLLEISNNRQSVKLQNWMAPVSSSLVAAVSLTKIKQPDGKKLLLAKISTNNLNDQIFLLNILSDIDDTDALRTLSNNIFDYREISQGLPSGVSPKRRLSDLTVNAFAKKFKLDYGYSLSSEKRYDEKELNKANDTIKNRLLNS